MDVDRRLFEMCEPVLEEIGYELVKVEVSGGSGHRMKAVLFIDKDGGVDVEDCAVASRGVEPVIEDSGLLPENYVLEVSSPGVDRPLYKQKDFERFAGNRAKIQLHRPQHGKRRNYTGRLQGRDEDGRVVIELDDGEVHRLAPDNIKKAHLVFEWK